MKRRIPSTIALSLFESAARHESFARAAAEMYLTVWPEGQQVYVEARPVNTFQHDIRPFADPTVVNDWQVVIQRPSGEVLYTSRLQRSVPCA